MTKGDRSKASKGPRITSLDEMSPLQYTDLNPRKRTTRLFPHLRGRRWTGLGAMAALALVYFPCLVTSVQLWGAIGLGSFLAVWLAAWIGSFQYILGDGDRSLATAPSKKLSPGTPTSSPMPPLTLEDRLRIGGEAIWGGYPIDREAVDIRGIFRGSWLELLDESELVLVHGGPKPKISGLAVPRREQGQVWEFVGYSNEEGAVHARRGTATYRKPKDYVFPILEPLTLAGPHALLPPGLSADWAGVRDLASDFEWRAPRSMMGRVAATLNVAARQAIREIEDGSQLIHITSHYTLVARAVSRDSGPALSLTAASLSYALNSNRFSAGSAADVMTRGAGDPAPTEMELRSLVKLGHLDTNTYTRFWGTFAWATAIITLTLSSLPFLGLIGDGPSERSDWHALMTIEAVWVLLMAAPGLAGFIVTRRLKRRQAATALGVMTLVDQHGFTLVRLDTELQTGWTEAPFGTARHLTCEPSARKTVDGIEMGAAYLEGDFGVGPLSRPLTSRVAWARLPAGAPSLDIIPEGFSTRVAKLFGGTDLDVESLKFNRHWRVRTADKRAAHALLAPTVIEAVDAAARLGLAIHFDADRVLVWDDGHADRVDLDERLKAVERIARAVPQVFGDGDA